MNVFDIIGPVMIGPSSSHTAGAARIGRIALALLGAPAVKACIELHGSFARTYKGHGTDKALIAGIMGMSADDSRIRNAVDLAAEAGLEVTFQEKEIEGVHPNSARIILTDEGGRRVSLVGSSIGGGNVRISEVNGLEVSITCERITLIVLHLDIPGTVAAVSEVLAGAEANICSFRLSRERRGGRAVMTIEIDGGFDEELNDNIRALPNIFSSTMLKPV